MSTTAQTVITGALALIGAFQPGETIPSAESTEALRRLNLMLGTWTNQPLTIAALLREVFDLTANKGSPTNPYTIGTGGNFSTTRPVALTGVSLLLTASDPDVERELTPLTEDGWRLLPVKDQTGAEPRCFYYKPTAPLGRLYLWPIPDNATNDLILYRREQFVSFADLATTSYDFQPGVEEALEYNLALRLAAPYGQEVPDLVMRVAAESLAALKRQNLVLTDQAMDPMFTDNRRAGYDINVG